MKKIFVFLTLFYFSTNVIAQSLAINTDGSAADASAILDVKSNVKGVLIPRLTAIERSAIATPANGLLVYDTDSLCFAYYGNTTWVFIKGTATIANNWGVFGNSGTTAANFIGTSDNQPIRFGLNKQPAGIIDSVQANTAIGYNSLRKNSTGSSNTANGYFSLYNNTTGIDNTATGTDALYFNSTGNLNTANGAYSLVFNTSGSNNTANGYNALYSNTTGIDNTANGTNALLSNIIGNYNTADGFKALYLNTTGSYNAACGSWALSNNITGSENTANGSGALYSNTSGFGNIGNGSGALYLNTIGNYNTVAGWRALYHNTLGNNNTAIGNVALYNISGNYNTAVGAETFLNNTAGDYNVAVGYNAGYYCSTTGNNQISIGISTGYPASNTAIVGNNSLTWIGGQVGWSALSDGRIKENIQEDVLGLSFIKLLRPVTYKLNIHKQQELMDKMLESNNATKKDSAFYAHKKEVKKDWQGKYDIEKITQTGFVAQEVEAAAKKLNYNFSGVTKPPVENGLYSLRYSDFIMPLVKSVQEQQQQIEMLQKQNEELLKRITALERK
jgi:trimeric autotransporter adhesin